MANLTGSTTAVFFVRLSTAVDEIVDVDWNTRDGTAIAGQDYEAASGTVSFLPGETEKAIDVVVYGQDDVLANGKKFYIELKPPANAVLTDALAECVITVADEDGVLVTSLVVAQGKRGLKGNPGLSAYEQAVLMGYVGTVEQWMEKEANAARAAERAEAAAVAANIASKVFASPESGVNPNTGVPVGDYFNVRSPLSTHYVDEYQNIGGAAIPTGKSYPSATGLENAIAATEANAIAAEMAATAANIAGKVYSTPEAGVDPVTGVGNGAYYNVRSPSDDNYLEEYQNIGGVAVATGKSYPSGSYVENIEAYTALPFKVGKSYALYERVQLDNGDIVKSTVANNAANPNVDMTGWVKTDDATQLKYKLKPNLLGSRIADKLAESVSVKDFGAIGDGTVHTIQEWVDAGKFSNLTEIQVVYPHATSLSDTIDWVACQAAIDFVGKGGTVLFNQTASNTYIINKPLKYHNGQRWVGCGGIDVLGLGTEIRLSTSATSVAEPSTPSSTTYGFNPVGIYFNALSYAPAALWLYNTSYSFVDQCAANCASADGGAFLFDSDTSKQCYFNKLNIPRAFASGTGGAAFKFVRGANANQIFGGKAGGSYRGAEFTTSSSGNLIIGTDFEENTDCHIYVDVANNVFIGTHMENAPIGFNITSLGTNTQRMNTTYATTTTVNVQDLSKVGTVLDTRIESSQTTGDLRFGGAKFKSTYLSVSTNLDYDPDLNSGSSNTSFRMFLNTNTTGAKHLVLYKGDGTSTESIRLDAGTGEIRHGDILQASSTNIVRKMIRAAAIPSTGTWSTGDKVLRTNPNTTNSVVTEWTCVTSGTPGTWAATGWYTKKDTTANRPTGLTSSDAGVQFFDTTLAAAGKPIWWTGSAWVDATGSVV